MDRSILLEVRPPTGEPDAGDPPVRFGGRGDRDHSVLPTPIVREELDSRFRGNDVTFDGAARNLALILPITRRHQSEIPLPRLRDRNDSEIRTSPATPLPLFVRKHAARSEEGMSHRKARTAGSKSGDPRYSLSVLFSKIFAGRASFVARASRPWHGQDGRATLGCGSAALCSLRPAVQPPESRLLNPESCFSPPATCGLPPTSVEFNATFHGSP